MTTDGEKVLYLAGFNKGFDLWSYEPRKQELKLVAKIKAESAGNMTLDKERKRLICDAQDVDNFMVSYDLSGLY